MAEILKSRFGFRKKNAAADSDAITEPAAAPPRPAGVERRRERADHVHGAHTESSATGKPATTKPPTTKPPTTKPAPATVKSGGDTSALAAFNLDDLAGQGRAALEEARAQARQILEQAQIDAEQIRQQAKEDGFAEGQQSAAADVDRRIAAAATEQSAASVATMQKTVAAIKTQLNDWMAQYNDHLSRMIVAATEKIVAKKLVDEPEMIVRWTADALATTRSAASLVVAIHPDTLVDLGDQLQSVLDWSELPEQTEIRPDESVAIGDVSIRQTGGEIRAGLSAQIQRLEELL